MAALRSLTVEEVPIDLLRPDPGNPRLVLPAQQNVVLRLSGVSVARCGHEPAPARQKTRSRVEKGAIGDGKLQARSLPMGGWPPETVLCWRRMPWMANADPPALDPDDGHGGLLAPALAPDR